MFDISPCKMFDCSCQCFVCCTVFSWFLDFPNISQCSKVLGLKCFGNVWGSYYVEIYIWDINFHWYLWWIKVPPKCFEAPKYYDQDCRQSHLAIGKVITSCRAVSFKLYFYASNFTYIYINSMDTRCKLNIHKKPM